MHKLQLLTDVALALHELPVPTIAKVTGVAVGAGWNLALGCDLVAATPESTFCQIFAKRGLSIDLGGSWLLPKIVGLQQAKRLALLAETITADEALALSLVTWLVWAVEIDAVANEARAQVGNFATVDAAEAYAAFAQKREPSFTGRWAVPRSERKDA